ncbi:MAG TPA: hypothetical protein PLB62_02060 [Candidatus Sumerlaeota bacterium]|nr:hypothetical protein [Candidatus Sumerlaeota bacterium]
MRRLVFAGMLMILLAAGGCVSRTDRCWVDDYRYKKVRDVYEKTQNLDLVRRHLENERQWRRCEINEIIYRLQKEYHLE